MGNINNDEIGCIPSELIVEDIMFLLKWLKQNHDTKMEETKNDEMDIDDNKAMKNKNAMDVDNMKSNDNQKSESSEHKWSSSKSAKKNRRKKLKEIKRLQAVQMLNNRNVSISPSKMKGVI